MATGKYKSTRYRDSKTGKWIKKEIAIKHPATTQRETNWITRKPKKHK